MIEAKPASIRGRGECDTGSAMVLRDQPASPDVRYTPKSDKFSDGGWSAMCHSRHFALRKGNSLLDHLVGALLQNQWHVQTKRLGGLEVNCQIVLGWCLHRQSGRLFAF